MATTIPRRGLTTAARRARAAGASILLAFLLAPTTASAALVLIFHPPAGPPGTEVTANTPGDGFFNPVPAREDFPTMFVKAEGQRVVLGRLQVDANGYGEMKFRVPDIPPGNYTVWLRFTEHYLRSIQEDCPECNLSRESGGPEFVVVDATGGEWLGRLGGFLAGVVAALFVVGVVKLARTRTRSSEVNSPEGGPKLPQG